ncbi:MAG: hypothetical protein ACFFER_08715 [Candidatus Thorarchaeota archaeon]
MSSLSYKKEIEVFVKSYQDDPIAQEIISMWIKTPSKASSNFGGDIFLNDMIWNLSHRYPEDVVREKVREVVLEIDQFYTSRRDPDNVTSALYMGHIEYGWEVCWDRIEKEIEKNPKLGHAMVPIFDYLWESDKLFQARGLDSKQPKTIDRILKDSPVDFEDLLKIGLFYKVTWVKKTTSNELRYIVPDTWTMMLDEGEDEEEEEEEIEESPRLVKPKTLTKRVFKINPFIHEGDLANIIGLSVEDTKMLIYEMADELNVTHDPSTGIYTSHDRRAKVKLCTNCTKSLGAIVSGQVVKCQYCGMDNVGD